MRVVSPLFRRIWIKTKERTIMNNYTANVTLGKDAETIKLGEREGRRLRVVDKTYGKKAIDRWFTAIVTGPDVATADRLRTGDQVMISGGLIQEEYEPKKPRYKGEKIKDDVMPFAKILQVTKSPSFFNRDEPSEAESATEGTGDTSAPDLTGSASPLAGVV